MAACFRILTLSGSLAACSKVVVSTPCLGWRRSPCSLMSFCRLAFSDALLVRACSAACGAAERLTGDERQHEVTAVLGCNPRSEIRAILLRQLFLELWVEHDEAGRLLPDFREAFSHAVLDEFRQALLGDAPLHERSRYVTAAQLGYDAEGDQSLRAPLA